MSAGTAMGIDLALVSTGVGNAQLPIGFIHTVPAGVDGEGESTFIYVSTVASLQPNECVVRADNTYSLVLASSAVDLDDIAVGTLVNDMTDAILGVAAGTIRFGFAQRSGMGLANMLAAGTGAFGDTASSSTAGDVIVLLGALTVGGEGLGTFTGPSAATVPVLVPAIFPAPINLWCRG